MELGSYWKERRIDPANYCPQRGEYPHAGCEVELYELGGPWSHLHGVCHGHKTVWHLCSGSAAHPGWPTLDELDDSYVRSEGSMFMGDPPF